MIIIIRSLDVLIGGEFKRDLGNVIDWKNTR